MHNGTSFLLGTLVNQVVQQGAGLCGLHFGRTSIFTSLTEETYEISVKRLSNMSGSSYVIAGDRDGVSPNLTFVKLA